MMTRELHGFWPPPPKGATPPCRPCDHAGCERGGEFRAPKSRRELRDYFWFCLEHVREYNASWDFYAGCSAEEIERQIRLDQTWRRPTWRLGQFGATVRFHPAGLKEGFGFFHQSDAGRPEAKTTPQEQAARRELNLAGPLTLVALKARYKELCKIHHPDANGGDKGAEERFKRIGQAYRTLMESLAA